MSSGNVARRAAVSPSSNGPFVYSNQMWSPHFLHSNTKGSPCLGINDQSEENEFSAAETTGLIGLVADSSKPLSLKQVHDANPIQLR